MFTGNTGNNDHGIVLVLPNKGTNYSSSITIGDQNTQSVKIHNTSKGKEEGLRVEGRGSSVIINTKDLYIDNGFAGIHVQSNIDQVPAPQDRASLTINAQNTTITDVTHGILNFSNGYIKIDGNLTVDADYAINVRGHSDTIINQDGSNRVQITGTIIFETPGSGQNSGNNIDANVYLNLNGPDSYWTGTTMYLYPKAWKPGDEDFAERTEVTGMHLVLSNSAQWNTATYLPSYPESYTQGYEALDDLELNGGIINLQDESGYTQVVEKVHGTGGTINVAAVKDDDGNYKPFQKIEFQNTDKETVAITQNYTGINADALATEDSAKVFDGLNAVQAGADAQLDQTQVIEEGDIYGRAMRKLTRNADGEFVGDDVTYDTNTKQDAYQTLTAMNYLSWRHDMNDLTKRMGELRDAPEGVGAWARIYGSEQEYGAQNLTTKSTSIQVGADADVGKGWKVGAAFSYTDGDTQYTLGTADNESYAAAIYGSWFSENGQFVDLIAKYTRMSSDFTLNGFEGDSDNNALSLSAEYGWHFKLNDIAFVEPQLELTYGRIKGDKFTVVSGTTVDQDDFESFIGRAGLRAGFYFPGNRGTVYARVSGAYDFMGESEYTASKLTDSGLVRQTFKDDLGGAWVEYAVGANFNWTENTCTYIDLERTSGGEVRENYRWNIGLRHTF